MDSQDFQYAWASGLISKHSGELTPEAVEKVNRLTKLTLSVQRLKIFDVIEQGEFDQLFNMLKSEADVIMVEAVIVGKWLELIKAVKEQAGICIPETYYEEFKYRKC